MRSRAMIGGLLAGESLYELLRTALFALDEVVAEEYEARFVADERTGAENRVAVAARDWLADVGDTCEIGNVLLDRREERVLLLFRRGCVRVRKTYRSGLRWNAFRGR